MPKNFATLIVMKFSIFNKIVSYYIRVLYFIHKMFVRMAQHADIGSFAAELVAIGQESILFL